ncbi:MAG: (2Fe-2S)-binding protein [Bdellovibrionales bacterium]
MDLPVVAEIKGRDRLEVTSLNPFKMKVIACHYVFDFLDQQKKLYGNDLSQWPIPEGHDHASLLIKELILKLKGQWMHVYQHEEVCHCRNVSLESLEQAIFLGAHSPEMISKWTSATTACGTCRSDVEKILHFRLK